MTALDAMLLDLGLPDIDGVDVCRQIRAAVGAPIVIISARTSPEHVGAAVAAGADSMGVVACSGTKGMRSSRRGQSSSNRHPDPVQHDDFLTNTHPGLLRQLISTTARTQ